MSRRHEPSRAAIDAAIDSIASDTASGAAEILRRAGAVFTILAERTSGRDAGDLELARQAVADACVALALSQPEMSPLVRLASDALAAARAATGPRQSLQAARDAALSFIENAHRASRDAASHAAALISDGATVLTHSRSSTALEALLEAKRLGREFSVVATESRPLLEGRELAQEIASQGIKVALIVDAAASLEMDHAGLVLIGADRVTPATLVNKIGTRMIALAARERGLPVFAVCDSSKFIFQDCVSRAIRDSRSPSELWPEAPPGVVLINRYFEPTPLEFFTGVITEDGVLSVQDAARLAKRCSIDQALAQAIEDLRDVK